MTTLYSYCLRFDDGAAPNPYWGTCTLAICKPAIRRTAKAGDWVAGLGSRNSPIGDISACLVYAMRVTSVFTLQDYDKLCRTTLAEKIPDWTSPDFRRKVGDCIYDFGGREQPKLRRSVHNEANRETDLSGSKVLLSRHFYYFGNKPIQLPEILLPIVHSTQGHKSRANAQHIDSFTNWIGSLGLQNNSLLGEPQLKTDIMSLNEEDCRSSCAGRDKEDDERDEIC
jgi:Nucleotide modification associated domain 2